MLDIREWKHVFKLDPERSISDEALERVCCSGTHAVMVGGSTGVTFENTVDLLSRIRRFSVPCVLEISHAEAIVPGFDYYFIPMVLNSRDPQWIVGQHREALRDYGALIDWSQVVPQGYVVLNEDSAVGRLTGAEAPLDVKDMLAYARLADKLLRLPIVYMEYSGRFGDMEWVRRTRDVLQASQLVYGGGIDGLEKARQAAANADTIVVGNTIYTDLERALETVQVLEDV
ncbi:heptaprenylglyceryl phosphate synthase [Paenibacillus sp. y28]|uniref:heptaprenylglyceryl phosphate synthase n=1 Tax=Paenibacillus sp. y28 TaxID=3129110 RepID=UPI003016DE84